MSSFSLSQIYEAARAAITIFAGQGLPSCLCGGTGCALYGTSRTPNDVDIVVLTSAYDTEELKRMVVRSSSKFELKPSRKIGATYKILYYRVYTYGLRACKVDILTPGIMHIPDANIPIARIELIDNLPAMPFMPLLLLKLQAWGDHGDSDRSDFRAKQYFDARDIAELLVIAVMREEHKRDASWLPASFLREAQRRVQRLKSNLFMDQGARDEKAWKQIGF
ncbi:hypothetical protein EIP91_005331 [Steccherinum ochraceum]|uniref:Uncharacterized protein n=1 Tax=Steccherinum ochraceum TaxID=92696 RepID=A0A4R0RIA3_9APHY|nr:hypothetical protein EIP91_005331 [Steccherinum ochraceum]